MRDLRRFVFFVFFCLLIGAALFPIEIFLTCIKFQATHYCKKALGASFSFESLEWKNGKIICKNGTILKPGETEAVFSEAALSPSLDLRGREIGGLLEIKGLRIKNRKCEPLTFPFPSSFSPPLISLNLKTVISDGEAYLYDFLGTAPLFQHIKFDVEHHILGKQTFGAMTFDWNEEAPKLTTHFWRANNRILRLTTDFNSHSFPAIYDLLTYFFHSILPEPLNSWKMQGGEIEGYLELALCEGDTKSLKGDMTVSNLHAENPLLELIGEVDHFAAKLDIDFDSLAAMNGEFTLDGGRLALNENVEFWQGIWDLSNFHTKISVQEGKVESTILHGNFMGMAGNLLFDWHSPDVIMRMGFQGFSKEIATLLPPSYQPRFEEAFSEDHFNLTASLQRAGEGLSLEGTLSIASDEIYALTFGCLFGRDNEANQADCFFDHLAKQFCFSQKRLGWFYGEQFPIEKFLSPFFREYICGESSGKIDVEGTFDDRYIVVNYSSSEISLESQHFRLAAATKDAIHSIDLQNHTHFGVLPLTSGEYLQKHRDLLFTDAQATVHFENKNIHIEGVEANWHQLHFKGDVEIETRARDDVGLVLRANYLRGPAADAQKLLSHFTQSIFWEIPFEGEVSSSGEFFTFEYAFAPDAKLLSGYVQGDFQGCLAKSKLECSGHVVYDLVEVELNFDSPFCSFHGLIGNRISLEGEGVSFHAEKLANGLHIQDFSYGFWEGEGDLEWDDSATEIRHLTIHDREKRWIAISGTYDKEQKILKGDIEDFQWEFGDTLSLWKPKGGVFGNGTFEWDFTKKFQAQLATSFKNLEFGGIPFGDGENLSCEFSSEKGLVVEGIEVEIPTEMGVEKYKLGRFSYDLTQQKILCEGFDFSLPPEKLPWVTELAENLFPGKVHPDSIDWVEAIKHNEPLEGRVSFEVYPDNIWVYLSLKDGDYHLSDKQYQLKNFHLLYDPDECNVWTQVFYKDAYHWVHFTTDSLTMSRGKFKISENELSPYQSSSNDAVVVDWERDREKGWCVHSVYGNYHGTRLDLQEINLLDFSDQIKLTGRIGVEAGQICSLLGNEATHFSIQGNYELEGSIVIPKEDFSKLTFAGMLTGSDLNFAGIELSSLTSDIHYSPSQLCIMGLSIKDWAGNLSLGKASIIQNNETWIVECDALKLEDVRLSRLRSPWTHWEARDKSFLRSFYIRSFELNQFKGDLSDLSSIVGEGSLMFGNVPKRTLFTNLLQIPVEITARIGLDLTSLIPVRGTIDYAIEDGRIHLNEFRDMYSDGKHSRFYLAEGMPAYIDFGGNLNLKLKMKQYNLLMKLAEFFTITVKGTLLNPKYTFTNQMDEE